MYVDLGLEWLQGLSVPAIDAWLMCFAINHRINLGGSLKLRFPHSNGYVMLCDRHNNQMIYALKIMF